MTFPSLPEGMTPYLCEPDARADLATWQRFQAHVSSLSQALLDAHGYAMPYRFEIDRIADERIYVAGRAFGVSLSLYFPLRCLYDQEALDHNLAIARQRLHEEHEERERNDRLRRYEHYLEARKEFENGPPDGWA